MTQRLDCERAKRASPASEGSLTHREIVFQVHGNLCSLEQDDKALLSRFPFSSFELPPVLAMKPPLSHTRASAESRPSFDLSRPHPRTHYTTACATARAKTRCSTARTMAGEEQEEVDRGEAGATAEAARPAHYARAQGTARRGYSHTR